MTNTVSQFDFETALGLLKLGNKVARTGWNGKNMFLYLVQESVFNQEDARPPVDGFFEEMTTIRYSAHIDMKTADGSLVPWLASQTDLLAEDWEMVE